MAERDGILSGLGKHAEIMVSRLNNQYTKASSGSGDCILLTSTGIQSNDPLEKMGKCPVLFASVISNIKYNVPMCSRIYTNDHIRLISACNSIGYLLKDRPSSSSSRKTLGSRCNPIIFAIFPTMPIKFHRI